LDEAIIGPHMGDDMNLLPSKIAITTEIMKQQRAAAIMSNGERYWNALYQNHPSNEMGNLVDITKFDLMNSADMYIQGKQEQGKVPIKPMEYNILSIDCTFSNKDTSDFVAMGLWGYRNNEHYLIHIVNMRLSFTQTINKIREILNLYKDILTVDEICIENKANGPAVIDVLRQEEGMPPIVEVDANRGGASNPNSKAARAKAITPYIERGLVHVATNSPKSDAEQIIKGENKLPHEIFLHEWKQFPFGKKDDLVDMTSQYLARAHKLITGEEAKYTRTIQKTSHWNTMMWRLYNQMTPEEQEEFVKSVGIPDEWLPDEE
jgi:predicted phage terminase large subunit-like protein